MFSSSTQIGCQISCQVWGPYDFIFLTQNSGSFLGTAQTVEDTLLDPCLLLFMWSFYPNFSHGLRSCMKIFSPFCFSSIQFCFFFSFFFTPHWVHWHDLELWRSKYCTNSANLFLCALHDWPLDAETLLYLQVISDAQVLDFINLCIISLIILELGKLIPLPTYINY